MTDLEDAIALSKWIRERVGEKEGGELVQWAREVRPPGVSFVDALAAMTLAIEQGGRPVAAKLVEASRKPKAQGEAEMILMAWAKSEIEPRFQGVPMSIGNAFADLQWETDKKLREMYPDADTPRINGAIVLGVQKYGDGFRLEIGTIVRCMLYQDSKEGLTNVA